MARAPFKQGLSPTWSKGELAPSPVPYSQSEAALFALLGKPEGAVVGAQAGPRGEFGGLLTQPPASGVPEPWLAAARISMTFCLEVYW